MIGSDNLERRDKKTNKFSLQSLPETTLMSGVVLNVGSFLTSLLTIDGISAVTFTFSFMWSMLYFALQVHSCGKRLSSYSYLYKTASKNSRLVNENVSCFNGKDNNHIEAPSDVAILLVFN